MAKILNGSTPPPAPPVTVEFTADEFHTVLFLLSKGYDEDTFTMAEDDKVSQILRDLDPDSRHRY